MGFHNCPRCNLAIRVRAEHLAPRSCPRCLARNSVAVSMFRTAEPAHLRKREALSTEAAPAAGRIRQGSAGLGGDTAA
jgi:hypothetical protein